MITDSRENRKRYKIIISDFDGTLLSSDGKIGARTKLAINEYVRSGGIFTVCTGRMLTSILHEMRALSVRGLVAALQGSVIADIDSGEIIRESRYETEDALFVLKELVRRELNVHVYTADALYVNYGGEYLDFYERTCKIKSVYSDDIVNTVQSRGLEVIKLLVMVDKADRAQLAAEIEKAIGEKYYVTSGGEYLIEITPVGHTKAAAVKFLSEYYSVEIEDILAIGDNLNDLPMLKAAGFGVAVGNATEELKRQADFVTVKNDDDAVGLIIEKYGLGE